MKEELIDNEIKSDAYMHPIGLLIRLYKPKTISELKDVLDDNGYFGRFKINRLSSNRLGHIIITISVYLPDSIFWYTWPHKNSYNLSLGSMVKSKKIRHITTTKWIMLYMVDGVEWRERMKDNSLAIIGKVFANLYGSWAYKYYDDIFKMIIDAGLIKIDKNKKIDFVIKSQIDVIEIYHNLFNPTMNPD